MAGGSNGAGPLGSVEMYADTGLAASIEGLDIDLGKSQAAGADVLILGPHNLASLYFWNVRTKAVVGTLSTGAYSDIEGIVTCRAR